MKTAIHSLSRVNAVQRVKLIDRQLVTALSKNGVLRSTSLCASPIVSDSVGNIIERSRFYGYSECVLLHHHAGCPERCH